MFPQVSVLGSVLFNEFINVLESRVNRKGAKFPNSSKLFRVVKTEMEMQ